MNINRLFIFFFLLYSILTLEAELLKYEEDKTTAILTINRPKALNALNSQVLEQLDKTLDSIDLNKIKALIITGAVKNLS